MANWKYNKSKDYGRNTLQTIDNIKELCSQKYEAKIAMDYKWNPQLG